ncbi:MAG: MATE family efflux transporter [Bacteroidota bacterium]
MKDLTVGKEGKLIFYFAMPMLIGNVFQILNTVIDRIIVGNYIGKSAVAAVGVSFPVIFAMISLLIGITSGITIIISQYFGARDFDKVKRAVDTAYIFLFFASIVIGITAIIFCEPIFRLLDVPENVLPDAVKYVRILFTGIIFMAGFTGTMAILRGLGDSKTPLYFMIISILLSIILEIIFIVYAGMGIEGAAYAGVISQAAAFLIATFYLNKKHEFIRISFIRIFFDRYIFLKSLNIGLPSGIQQFSVAVGQMFLIKLVDSYGTDTVAAYTIAGGIDSFAILPAMNFSMALMAFTGQNIGAGKYERVRKGLFSTQWMTGLISVSVSILVLVFAIPLMSAFTGDAEVIRIGKEYLMIIGGFYILFSVLFVNTGVFRGAGDTLAPMIITLFTLWVVRIPLAYYLSEVMGVHGIWWSLPIAWMIGVGITISYYLSGKWKKKVLIKPVTHIE